jgi:UrcA family protein
MCDQPNIPETLMYSTKAFLPLKRASLAQSLLACVLTAAAAAASAGPACADDSATAAPSDATAVRVSYRDLDLATDAGSKALYERIRHAAHEVCAVSDIRDLTALAQSDRCERAAVSNAVRQVHNARFAALVASAAAPRG